MRIAEDRLALPGENPGFMRAAENKRTVSMLAAGRISVSPSPA